LPKKSSGLKGEMGSVDAVTQDFDRSALNERRQREDTTTSSSGRIDNSSQLLLQALKNLMEESSHAKKLT
jgi:hypothetical protein